MPGQEAFPSRLKVLFVSFNSTAGLENSMKISPGPKHV